MKHLIVIVSLGASMLAWAGTAAADPGPNVCHRLRNAIASGTPVSKLPPRLVRQCFGNHMPGRSTAEPAPTTREAVRPASSVAPTRGGH